MISLFKPTTRFLSVTAAALVLTVACITFTGAAQKDKARRDARPATAANIREQSLEALDKELAKIEAQVQDQEKRVEHLRHDLRIPSHVANSDGNQPGPDNEILRKLVGLRIEAQADHQRISVLYDQLARLGLKELRKIIQTAVPDQQLTPLFERLADSEQRLASLSHLYAAEHPEVKALTRAVEKINQQIDERLEGVLAGLKARQDSVAIQEKELRRQIEEYAQRDLNASTKYRDFFNARRGLDNLYTVRDRLHLRLLEEKIDAALLRK